jgi:hypothetical protein
LWHREYSDIFATVSEEGAASFFRIEDEGGKLFGNVINYLRGSKTS